MNNQGINIDIGHPEVLQVGGIALLLSGFTVAGCLFCGFGFLGALFRFTIKIQKMQADVKAKEAALQQVSDAGGELAETLSALFGGKSGRSSLH
tara:strand:+ start:521 stop:802 length:282 start_codon:yes stop_codon:yes gene_type:complete